MENIAQADNSVKLPRVGDIIEGRVIEKGKSAIFFELGNFKTGTIYGKEYQVAKETLKDLKIGDTIPAKIVDIENDEGYVELSIFQAGRELAWETLQQKKEKGEILEVEIQRANKGGLMAEISGIPAFLPVSQLSAEHYPRVEGGDSLKILKELQKFIGKKLEVKIFDVSQRDEKLILSEKANGDHYMQAVLENYKVGDVVEGEITAVLDFGAFIKFKKDSETEFIEGLIHISELDWQLIDNPADVVKAGEKVTAKIIDISDNKVSLSLKALKTDPWEGIDKKYKAGDVIKGKVTKLNPFGAFVQLTSKETPNIQGLIHISEFGTQATMKEKLNLDQEYDFEIVSILPAEHKMSLKLAVSETKS